MIEFYRHDEGKTSRIVKKSHVTWPVFKLQNMHLWCKNDMIKFYRHDEGKTSSIAEEKSCYMNRFQVGHHDITHA